MMRRLAFAAPIAAICLAALLSCGPLHTDGVGTIKISFASPSGSRTVAPVLSISRYTVSFSGPSQVSDLDTADPSVSASLPVGDWAISAIGYDSSGKEVATGNASATVSENQQSGVAIAMSALATGTGSVDISISWPAGISISSARISLDGTEVRADAVGFDAANRIVRYADSLAAGTYVFSAALARSGDTTFVSEAIQVSGNLTSAKAITLAVADFTQVPEAPAGLSAQESSGGLALTWTCASRVETGYRVERALSGSSSWTTLTDALPANATGYSDSSAVSGTSYQYRAYAYNAIGYSTASGAATGSWSPPACPGYPSFGVPTASSVTVSWTAATDNATAQSSIAYRLYRSLSSNIGTVATAQANGVPASDWSTGTSAPLSGLSASTTYYFNVLARDSAGNVGAYSQASVTTAAAVSTQIIANHSVVDRYAAIPAAYLAAAKKMWLDLAGESHSSGVRNGMAVLESINSNYDSSVRESGTPEGASTTHLRVSRATWGDHDNASSWIYGYGEEDWYTNSTAIARTKAHIAYCEANGHHIDAIGFGWCWDMMWLNPPGGTVDPVYGVHWAGSSNDGPQDNRIWGLDSDDADLTDNSVCMDSYLSATQAYVDYCAAQGYTTKVFFSTGPVDNAYDGTFIDENAAQRQIKNDYIRAYVAKDASRILFDYADIVSWDDAGNPNVQTWTDGKGTVHSYQMIADANTLDGSYGSGSNEDHIGQVGALRLAKAAWWMMARIAGWDGVSTE